jgi:hypothetical protein
MKLQISVPFNGALAYYEVFAERDGIYQAQLVGCQGKAPVAPPETLTLTRSVRRWVGSSERPELIDRIGQELDLRLNRQDSRNASTSDPSSTAQ